MAKCEAFVPSTVTNTNTFLGHVVYTQTLRSAKNTPKLNKKKQVFFVMSSLSARTHDLDFGERTHKGTHMWLPERVKEKKKNNFVWSRIQSW